MQAVAVAALRQATAIPEVASADLRLRSAFAPPPGLLCFERCGTPVFSELTRVPA
ncbi:MAG: hypothetical protein NVS4B3_24250 [Gemmatimonadaceae bacterium]